MIRFGGWYFRGECREGGGVDNYARLLSSSFKGKERRYVISVMFGGRKKTRNTWKLNNKLLSTYIL